MTSSNKEGYIVVKGIRRTHPSMQGLYSIVKKRKKTPF